MTLFILRSFKANLMGDSRYDSDFTPKLALTHKDPALSKSTRFLDLHTSNGRDHGGWLLIIIILIIVIVAIVILVIMIIHIQTIVITIIMIPPTAVGCRAEEEGGEQHEEECEEVHSYLYV